MRNKVSTLEQILLFQFLFLFRFTQISRVLKLLKQIVMSSRALRRLQEGSGVQGLPCTEPRDGDDGEEGLVHQPFTGTRAKISAPHLNPFDLVTDSQFYRSCHGTGGIYSVLGSSHRLTFFKFLTVFLEAGRCHPWYNKMPF
jgi:hypothetical protein